MDGWSGDQQRASMAEAVAQQRLALALASIGPERAPAASPETEDRRRANELTPRVSPKMS
jgi:hypothetical protein